MGRGCIYEVYTEETQYIGIKEDMFYESVDSLAIDYVLDISAEEQNDLKKRMLDILKKSGAKIIKKDDMYGFILSNEVKMSLFCDRYHKAKEFFEQMSLKEFSTSDLYSLRELIHEDYDDCVYAFDSLYPFDQWIREAECNVPYYLGNIVLMH